ncbi:Imm7 family immunity protein [Micromonospora matsumotoense]|uniref:Imm7 family immunity protein n=1 Tax=Micromonospora matsumotoense TaxID=121616 RepID=UPI0033FDD4D1
MFEYHGWITLRSTADAVDDDPPLRLDEIRNLINGFTGYGLMDLRPTNGAHHVHLGGFPNHRGTRGADVVDLFTRIGRLAPGSYGLLYVHDDEDPEHNLAFRVHRLVRGTVSEHADHLLSPAIPTLEDDYLD